MTTIRDVAAEAGVSIATVSRVINGTGYASEEARRRVRAAMRKLAYHPNAIARDCAASDTFGRLRPTHHDRIFSTLVFAIERRCSRNGFSTLLETRRRTAPKETTT